MKFERETYSDILLDEMVPLWTAHYNEISDKFYGPLDPDIAIYSKMNLVDSLRIYTAREGDALLGYQVFFIGTHPHSRHSIEATQDLIYLAPSARKGLTGYRFIDWCCGELRKEGVQVVHQRISARHNFGSVLERMGFELEDLTYSRRLSEVA